jgi:metal-responsive CopG/Arc/MetJ family transcriptional regulator
MKVLSLKLKDDVFEELESVMQRVSVSRNAYINEAIRFYNKMHRKQIIRKQIRYASKLVGEQSLKMAQELEGIDNHLLGPYD